MLSNPSLVIKLQKTCYIAGEQVKGRVLMNLPRPFDASFIVLEAHGRESIEETKELPIFDFKDLNMHNPMETIVETENEHSMRMSTAQKSFAPTNKLSDHMSELL